MSEASYSLMLRNLSSDYYHQHISIDEYRIQRKKILDKLDMEFNGRKPEDQSDEDNRQSPAFMETVSFYNNSEIDK